MEVVDNHAPAGPVHEQALQNGTKAVEIPLRAEREFTEGRRHKALDASLTVKSRLQELAAGRLVVDAHNLLCRRPKCRECGTPLPMRTVTVSAKDCWGVFAHFISAESTRCAAGPSCALPALHTGWRSGGMALTEFMGCAAGWRAWYTARSQGPWCRACFCRGMVQRMPRHPGPARILRLPGPLSPQPH